MSGLKRREWLGATALYLLCAAFVYRGVFRDGVLAGRDAFHLFMPQGFFLLDRLRHGELPLWLPNARLGQPFVATLQSQVFYPLQLIPLLLLGPYRFVTAEQIAHAVIGALGVFVLCRKLRCSRVGSAFAGAAFGFTPMLTGLCTAPNVAAAAIWAGWLLVATHRVSREPDLKGAALLGLFGALALLAGSPEGLLWEAPLCFGCAWVWAKRRGGAIGFVALGFAWAFCLGAVAAIPTLELTLHSTRAGGIPGKNAFPWSNSWLQLLASFWQGAEYPRGAYWGPDQFLLPMVFIGSLATAFAVAAVRRARRVVPFAVGGVSFALLSLGSHFPLAAMVLRLPPFHFFRFPAKYFVGYAFCVAVLSASGIDRVAVWARRRSPVFWRAAAWTAACAVLAGVGYRFMGGPVRQGMREGCLWLGFWFGVAGALWWALPKHPLRARRLSWALAGLAAVELAISHVAFPGPLLVHVADLERPSKLASMLPRSDPGRLSIRIDEIPETIEETRDWLEPLRWIEDGLSAIEGYGPPVPALAEAFYKYGARGALDLAGVSYFVRSGGPPYPDLETVYEAKGSPTLYRSRTAHARAFVARRSTLASDFDALRAVQDPHQPARFTAFLASGEALESNCDAPPARIVSETANTIAIDAEACAESYLVLADSYFPGWEATVDGAPARIERADYALRAVKLGPGRHRVRMVYRPGSFVVGSSLSIFALLAAALTLAARKRARGESAPVAELTAPAPSQQAARASGERR